MKAVGDRVGGSGGDDQGVVMKKGWPTKTLGETCEVVNGGTPKTGVSEYWDGQHRWITPAEMGKRLSPYVSETERMISDLGLRNSSAQMLPPHSVILSSRAPIGHLVINTELMATNQGCKGPDSSKPTPAQVSLLLPQQHRGPAELARHWRDIQRVVRRQAQGMSRFLCTPRWPNSSGSSACWTKRLRASPPPKPTPKRTSKTPAPSSKATCNPSSPSAARGGWRKHLKEVCEKITDGTHQTPKYFDEGVVFLSSRNVTSGKIDWEKIKHIDTKQHLEMHKRVAPRRGEHPSGKKRDDWCGCNC